MQRQSYSYGRRRRGEDEVAPPATGDRHDAAAYDGVSRTAEQEYESNEEGSRTLELREEQLVAHKELRDVGEIEVRTEIEDVAGRLEVDAYREEVEIEHEPVGQVVSERRESWEEDGVLVVPVYEEQLVVTKRLVLRERLRVRRVGTTERRLFEDTLRRERLVVDDPQHTGLVHEQYPTGELAGERSADHDSAAGHTPQAERQPEGGFLGQMVRKALE